MFTGLWDLLQRAMSEYMDGSIKLRELWARLSSGTDLPERPVHRIRGRFMPDRAEEVRSRLCKHTVRLPELRWLWEHMFTRFWDLL